MLELVPSDHPLLRQRLAPFDFSTAPVDPAAMAGELADLLLRSGGVGLAANQAGLAHRFFVMWASPVLHVFNPRVTDSSTETVLLEEACLSFPHLTVTVRRPRAVRVRFQLSTGEFVVRRFEGMTARVFQHEMDHLDGKLFFERASRPKLEAAVRRAKKAGVAYTMQDLLGKKKK